MVLSAPGFEIEVLGEMVSVVALFLRRGSLAAIGRVERLSYLGT